MKVLVTVSSRHGSTQQIADCIHEELEGSGMQVHVLEPSMVTDLAGYDAVVLGSAVYAGRWLAPARKLAARLEAELLRKPVWLFSSGPIGNPAKPVEPPIDGVEIARRLHAVDHQVFEGRILPNQLGIAERLVVRFVGAESGDFRSWLEIGGWARSIASTLKAGAVPVAASA